MKRYFIISFVSALVAGIVAYIFLKYTGNMARAIIVGTALGISVGLITRAILDSGK